MWDGTERRKNGINGREIINEVKSRLDILETRFEDRWASHDKMADDRQKATCGKLDEIRKDVSEVKTNAVALDKASTILIGTIDTKLASLPCKERASWYSSMRSQMIAIWVFLSGIVLAIIGAWVKK